MESPLSRTSVDADWLGQRLSRGLGLLLAAARYVEVSRCEKCQLAIRLEELSSAGVEPIDCRWLLIQGLVDHVSETTYPGDVHRTFRNGDAILTHQSCFMLTASGADFAESILRGSMQCELPAHTQIAFSTEPLSSFEAPATGEHNSSSSSLPAKPHWDMNRQELWFSGRLVKQYRIPSPNQIAILCAFEEDGWPSRVDDPLPQVSDIDPRRRLNDTIRNLNRSRASCLIRFCGDGSGQGILWQPEEASAPETPCVC